MSAKKDAIKAAAIKKLRALHGATDYEIGHDEADIKEFQEAIDDFVSGLSLFSCSSAKGPKGDKLLELLASS